VIIAGAGGAAHLPGMMAAKTSLPVLGVPVQSKALNGIDSLLSIVQMPAGVPSARSRSASPGATNAALLAASILSIRDENCAAALDAFRRARRRTCCAHRIRASRKPMKIGDHRRRPARRMLALAGYPLPAVPVPRLERRHARRPHCPIVTGAFDDLRAAPARERRRPADVRVRERARRDAAGVAAESLPAADRGAARVAGRLLEKQLFRTARHPTPPFRAVDTLDDLRERCSDRLPAVLQDTARSATTARASITCAGRPISTRRGNACGVPLILEGFVHFDSEVSIIGARSTHGETRVYPAHAEHASRRHPASQRGPASTREAAARRRASSAQAVRHFEYAGVLTIEFFVHRGRLVANEMAPRVHNSGTLDDRRRSDVAVRESFARYPRSAAGRHDPSDTRPW
jgi:hypothetical protein